MELALILLNQVFVMFLLILIGVVCLKTKAITPETNKQLGDIALLVVMPCVILHAYQTEYDPALAKGLFIALALAILSHVIAILISFTLRKSDKRDVKPEKFSIIYANAAFMAIPLITATFGDIGVFYLSAYITVFNLLQWTHGIFLMSDKKDKQNFLKQLLSPAIVCICIGLLIFFFRITLPSPISKVISFVADMNTPLAMIATGGFIAQTNIFKAFTNLRVYFIAFIKLILLPLICMGIFKLLPVDPTISTVMLIVSACPCATSTIFFSSRFNRDSGYASQLVTLSTLLSIITIPLIVYIQSLI